MANNTSTFQGDEFSNNLFSDLGPLLALFGERVATQYLRHSTRKLESLIFACAPLGILTAITSAIRVGGDRKLKAMIGRAEEPDAVAEIELISSTSVDVCELWNGVGLVRVVGKPHILELVIDDDLLSGYGNHQTGSGDSRESSSVKVYGLYTRKGMNALWPDPKCVDKFNPESIAPGISLNTIGSFTSNWEVYAAAVFGVILQLAVLAGDAIITYKYRLEKGGRAVATYAFPLTCIGTLGLVFGMYLCASIIEVSTQELEWLPISAAENNFGTRQYRILWVQKGQTVGDQRFASYAIYAPSQHHTLMTSHRRVGATLHRRTIAAMTVSFGDSLRAMHYSASIAQLIATIIMTAIRVAIRRHISQEPQRYTYATENEVQPVPPDSQLSEEIELTSISGPQHQSQHPVRYTVQELKDGHELDIIAKQLQNCKLWQIVSFWEPDQDTRLSTNTSTGKLAESVFETRIRLTELLHSPWHTEFVDKAKILSETMADVMNFLWSSEGILGSMPKLTADSVSKEELCWKIPIDVRGDGCHRIESISMSLTRKQLADEKWKPWEAYVTRVEAVLQLWMLQLSKYTKGEGNVLWVLCPDDDYKATMIADWWIGRDVGSEYSISTIAEPHEGSPKYIIGCIGSNLYTSVPAYTQNVTRAFVQHMELGNFAAQYIFYTFLAHLVQSIDEVTTPTVVRDEEAAGPLLRNDTIMDVALKVEERGLFTVAEAYRMVLCAFAQNGKLPVPYHQSSHPFLVLYQKALKLGHKYKGEDDKSSPAALRAEKIYDEALRLCRFEALELINHKKWGDAGALLVRAARISEVFSTKGGEHLKEIKDLMHVVGSKCLSTAASVDAKADTFPHPPTSSRPELISPPSKLITAVLSQDVNKVQKLLLEAVNDNSTDSSMDNARALDHAAQLGNKEILILLHLYGALSQRAPLSAELSCTPLWWAVDGTRSRSKVPSGEYSRVIETDCDVEILELLLGFGHDPNRLEPKEGESPLHLAAKLNLMKAMRTLLAKVEPPSTHRIASINLKDKNGLSSLYYATKAGHGEMAKLLLTHGANVEGEIGPQNRSPVHYAARHGDHVVLKILHEKGGDIGAFDNDGRSPIYYAAKDGGKKVLDINAFNLRVDERHFTGWHLKGMWPQYVPC
ncbi:hypothetical protein EV426DRAFT_571430 [Tirmania nivea]|nr:hypothetical protein EV426DRAFT_571430 [Tirmania nivea]